MKFAVMLATLMASASCTNTIASYTRVQLKHAVKLEMFGNATTHVGVDLSRSDPDLLTRLVQDVVFDELTRDNVGQVARFLRQQSDAVLRAGYMRAYQTLRVKNVDDAALFDLAYEIAKDTSRCDVASLTYLFPPSMRYLVAGSVVNVHNGGYGEYLFAGGDQYKRDETRRNVYTWVPRGKQGKFVDFRFERIRGNQYYIVNTQLGEYLYAEVESYSYDCDRRSVFTARRVESSAAAAVWTLEVDGNDVFIKNSKFKEYLQADDCVISDNQRRHVFTLMGDVDRAKCDAGASRCRWVLTESLSSDILDEQTG